MAFQGEALHTRNQVFHLRDSPVLQVSSLKFVHTGSIICIISNHAPYSRLQNNSSLSLNITELTVLY